MPDIVIVHVPRIPAEAVQELETALQSISEDVSSRGTAGEHAFFHLLLPAAVTENSRFSQCSTGPRISVKAWLRWAFKKDGLYR